MSNQSLSLEKIAVVLTIVSTLIGAFVLIVAGVDRFSRLEGKVDTLIMDIKRINEKRDASLNEINAAKKKVLAEIAKAQEEPKRLRDNAPVIQASEEIAKAQQAISELQNRLSSAERQLNALNQAVQVTKEDIAKTEQEFSAINRQGDKAVADIAISELQNRLSSTENKLKALTEALQVFQEKMAQAQPKPVNNNPGENAVKPEQSTATYPLFRFIDNGDGTITDRMTRLIWLTNANCFDKQDWYKAKESAQALAEGQCGLSDGSKAGDWYLPTQDELVGLLDKGYSEPALSNAVGMDKWTEGDAFSGVQSSQYWSSTTYTGNTSFARDVNLKRGYVDYHDKTNRYYVWPVRGRQ